MTSKNGHSSLSEYSNSTSFSVATSFFHVFKPFFLCFWPVSKRSRVCRNMVESLSALVQESVKPLKAVFVLFPIRICLLMANLVTHWSNTTKRFLRSTMFAAISEKDTITNQFCNTLTHCAAVQQMGVVCGRITGPYANDYLRPVRLRTHSETWRHSRPQRMAYSQRSQQKQGARSPVSTYTIK